MKTKLKILFIALLFAVFATGCGCGGGGGSANLVSIEVTPADPSIALGTHQQFTATGIFSNDSRKDITNSVIWSSSDVSIATISNETGIQGLATSQAVGSTTITATSGSISGSTTLTVKAAVLVSITVSPLNPSVAQGMRQQFTAIGIFSDNTMQDITTSVEWSSSDSAIATISNNVGSKGSATGVAAGTAGIIATAGNISGSASLTVTAASLLSITVTPEIITVGYNTTVQYTATGHFSDNSTQDITTLVTWSSSDTSVATISNQPGSKGLATTDGVSGSTVITATLGNISGSALLIDP